MRTDPGTEPTEDDRRELELAQYRFFLWLAARRARGLARAIDP